MEKARALIFDSNMKKEMWGEAVYTATFLLNRSPTTTTECTPIEMWEHKKPDLRRLQLFGCDAYAKVLGPLKKLDERYKKYTFVGYAPVGYRLWDSSKRKIHIARDVKFGNLTKKEEKEAQDIDTKNLNLLNKKIIEENEGTRKTTMKNKY